MSRSIRSPRHRALTSFLIQKRLAASLTQAEVAKRLGRYQSFIARVENGQKVLDVVELLEFSEALGFDAREAIRKMLAARE